MRKHTFNNWNEFSPRAYVANGFIGFRFGKDPFHDAYGLLAGFTSLRVGDGVESWSILPTPWFDFKVNGRKATPEFIRQNYDFSCGEFETEVEFRSETETVYMTYTVFCSRTSPTMLISEFKMKATKPVTLEMHVEYGLYERWVPTIAEIIPSPLDTNDYDGKALAVSADRTTSAGIAFRAHGAYSSVDKRGTLEATYTCNVTEEWSKVQLMTSYVPSAMHSEPHNQAHRMLKLADWSGFDRLRKQNADAWAKIWESRITVEGAGEGWQDAIDASYFYLMSSSSEFAPASVAPFALSNPDAYQGHVFWDTESFIFMTPLLCSPDIARSMLDYRFKRMPAAENNARLNGYRGIQFPWQSGTTGSEVTVPWAGQAGGAGEQHVNLDVALAFDGYARISGDPDFIREQCWPIMRGVADWIVSRCEKTDRGYEILHVTGIDEETDDVPNDSYTNLMSIKILRSAAEYSVKLGYGERKQWLKIADEMFVPTREDGVLPQYEGMPDKEQQPSTTLMSYFPYGYTTGDDRASIQYYIDHGMERYLHYPMLTGFLGVYPAWLGDRKKALEFYNKANLTFFIAPFFACTEWSTPNEDDRLNPKHHFNTSFITGRGSLLAGLLLGLTKICPWNGAVDGDPEAWLGKNIILPDGWEKITLGKIYIRGKAYRATAVNGAERTVLEELPE